VDGTRTGRRRSSATALAAVAAGALALTLAGASRAGATLVVTTTGDVSDGACTATLCTLRDAVEASNAAGGATVSIPAGRYVLTNGPLYATAPLELDGAGTRDTIVDGNDTEQVVRGDRTNAPAIVLKDLTITGGRSQSADAPDYNEGGGIISWGPLTLDGVAVVGNDAYADGGGLASTGDLTIVDSTIANNTAAGDGGGVRAQSGTVSIVDSTIADNTASSRAGLEIDFTSSATVSSTTIAGNTNTTGPGLGSLAVAFGSVSLENDAIANDLTSGEHNCQWSGFGGTIVSLGHNLATDGSCGLTGTGDLATASSAGLGALADNGGETDTLLPQTGSPLVDAGADCPATDQRGDPRPVGAACDIGSVEVQSAAAGQPPTASFAETANGLSVSVDGSGSSDSDGTIVSYAWNFGDGAAGTGVTATHTYAAAGTYTITLTVTDDGGATGTVSRDVTVVASAPANVPPTAAFTSAVSGLAVSLNASGSSDADGSITSYVWDFGDGSGGAGNTTTHAYGAAGTYTVRLTVTDDGGATDSVTHDVTVAAASAASGAPVVSDASVTAVSATTATISFAIDPDGLATTARAEYGLDARFTGSPFAYSTSTPTVDLGAGDSPQSGSQTITGLLPGALYHLRVTATNAAGTAFGPDLELTTPAAPSPAPAPDHAPTARITISPAAGDRATTFAISGRTSSDPDDGIAAYGWDLGDGTFSTARAVDHRYARAGTYRISLTVTDRAGKSSIATATVTVTNAPPVASFVYVVRRTSKRHARSTRTVELMSTSSDPDGSVVDETWSFGDGATGHGPLVTHTYRGTATTFVVTLTVRDDSGATATFGGRVKLASPPAAIIDDEAIGVDDVPTLIPPLQIPVSESVTVDDPSPQLTPPRVVGVVEQIATGDGGTPGNQPPSTVKPKKKGKKR
jgi:CSLREA domain-containing protein